MQIDENIEQVVRAIFDGDENFPQYDPDKPAEQDKKETRAYLAYCT